MDATLVAELLFRQWSGGDASADSGLELQDFEYAVKQARAYKIRYDYFLSSRVEGERIINQGWLREFKNVAVTLDEETNAYQAVLPAQPISLPHDLGLYHVSPMKNFQAPFMPQTIGESFLFESNPQDNITFHYDAKNIYFDNFDPSIEKIYIQMIPLSDSEIPDEFTTEISDLVLNRFLKTKTQLEDKLTNTNPNKEEVMDGKQ